MAFVIICIKGILAPYPKDIVGTSFPQPIRNTELTTLVLISYQHLTEGDESRLTLTLFI